MNVTTYTGWRLSDGRALVEVERHDGTITFRSSLNEEFPVFNWGYDGGGPWYLAQFLLQDATQTSPIGKACINAYVRDFVANWNDGWSTTSQEIMQWYASHSPIR